MKHSLRKLFALGSLAFLSAQGLTAAPLFTIGDSVDVFFNGGTEVRYQTNVFLTETLKQDDWTWIISPGAEARYGRGGIMGISVVFREDFYLYDKNTRLDTANANLFISSYYDAGGKIRGNAGFSFVQVDQNDADLLVPPGASGLSVTSRNLVSRNLYHLPIELQYDFSPKTYFEGGFVFDGTHYTSFRRLYEDQYSYTVPLDVLYRYSPKLDIGAGYQFRYTDLQNPDSPPDFPARAIDRYDHFFYGMLKGELTAKLGARIRLGVTYHELDKQPTFGSKSDTTLGIDSQLLYQYSVKLSFIGGVNRDFSAGSVGQGIRNTGFNVGSKYDFSDYISANASLDYTNSKYISGSLFNRSDDTWNGRVSATYRPNEYLAFNAGFAIQYNDSNLAGLSYQNNIYSLSATLRY